MIDFSNQLFRCSSIGALMTNQQGKRDTTCFEEISETAKEELVKIYVSVVYKRDKEITNKYIEKGLAVEEDSITLVSRIHKKPYFKNSERWENHFISGEPDLIDPLIDTKSCWDIHSFYKHKAGKLKKEYFWQMQGYADLLNKDQGIVAFCLIDTPDALIQQEKKNLFYKMNYATMENPDYLAACAQIDKEMTFGDIPMGERIHEVTVKRAPEYMEQFYKRVPLLREWLNEFANIKVLV